MLPYDALFVTPIHSRLDSEMRCTVMPISISRHKIMHLFEQPLFTSHSIPDRRDIDMSISFPNTSLAPLQMQLKLKAPVQDMAVMLDPSKLPDRAIILPAPRSGPRLGGESRFSNSLRANIVFSSAQLKRSSPGGRTAAR